MWATGKIFTANFREKLKLVLAELSNILSPLLRATPKRRDVPEDEGWLVPPLPLTSPRTLQLQSNFSFSVRESQVDEAGL